MATTGLGIREYRRGLTDLGNGAYAWLQQFFLHCFGAFDFHGIEQWPPTRGRVAHGR